MKYLQCLCLVLAGLLLKSSGPVDGQTKKSFTFSADPNLEIRNGKGNGDDQDVTKGVDTELWNLEKQHEETKQENEQIKDLVNAISENVKEKSELNKLSKDQFSSAEEEEARENGKFLTDEMEESAQNFSESNEPGEVEADQHIQRYQAEVIKGMSPQGVYHKMDRTDLESVSQAFDESEETCSPDLSLPCPDHFFLTSSGCVPTPTYSGPCNQIQDKLVLLQDRQKVSWGEVCGTQWPCMPDVCPHGTDYVSTCPVGWTDMGKGVCRGDQSNSPCGNERNFARLSKEDKQKLERECNIRWRCKSVKFVFNFESQCPMHWVPLGKYQCEAPQDYRGNCPKISNLKKYQTEQMKRQIEIACLVTWPYQVKVLESQRDYSVGCPIGWAQIQNGFCKAPENYPKQETCPDVVSFESMEVSQKMSYATACHVDFPFVDKSECVRDYSFACPLGWVPTNRSGFCKSPASYKSPICNNVINFNNLTDRHKQYYQQFCHIDWPCEGEIENSMMYVHIPVSADRGSIRKRISGAVDSITGLIV